MERTSPGVLRHTVMEDSTLAHRLSGLGMALSGARLERARRLVAAHGAQHEQLSDIVLMTLCVEAYRDPDEGPQPWF